MLKFLNFFGIYTREQKLKINKEFNEYLSIIFISENFEEIKKAYNTLICDFIIYRWLWDSLDYAEFIFWERCKEYNDVS